MERGSGRELVDHSVELEGPALDGVPQEAEGGVRGVPEHEGGQ